MFKNATSLKTAVLHHDKKLTRLAVFLVNRHCIPVLSLDYANGASRVVAILDLPTEIRGWQQTG